MNGVRLITLASARSWAQSGDAIILDFRQTGYDERSPFYAANNSAWEPLLHHFKQVVES